MHCHKTLTAAFCLRKPMLLYVRDWITITFRPEDFSFNDFILMQFIALKSKVCILKKYLHIIERFLSCLNVFCSCFFFTINTRELCSPSESLSASESRSCVQHGSLALKESHLQTFAMSLLQTLTGLLAVLHHTVMLKETGFKILSDSSACTTIFLFILVIFGHSVELSSEQV